MSILIKKLRYFSNDRGMMANLRCALVESKKHRAWPVLNRLGVDLKDNVAILIAGLFATHSAEQTVGNFGATCKVIEMKRGEKRSDDNKLTPTERRFQHLLSAEPGTELYERVIRLVLMAESQDVPINYIQLEIDLRNWMDWKRTEWASAFWTPCTISAVEE